jgi:hypothetical protein
VYFANPLTSTVTVYMPGSRFGRLNVPAALVVVSAETFVATFVAVTLAPAMTAPLGSVTSPRSVPSIVCAPAILTKTVNITVSDSRINKVALNLSSIDYFSFLLKKQSRLRWVKLEQQQKVAVNNIPFFISISPMNEFSHCNQ